MGQKGMVFSVIAAVAGAIMYFAITTPGSGFRLATVGVILMVAGVVGFIASVVVFSMSRQGSSKRTFDKKSTDSQGVSTVVHEETR